MKNIIINEPKIGIVCQPYYSFSPSEPNGYSNFFVIWDQAKRPSDWFDKNKGFIISDIDDANYYNEAFDIHTFDPSKEQFQEINFNQLDTVGEIYSEHLLDLDECIGTHLLYIRVESGQYVLNGGYFCSMGNYDSAPATWQEMINKPHLDFYDFFEFRVHIDSFRKAYAKAVDELNNEKLPGRFLLNYEKFRS